MKAVVEPLEGNKVKLSIEVDAQEFERSIDAAFRKISREVRVPGFRPGKAPRRILEARLGVAAGRAEALRDSLPEYYAKAVREHDVDVIAAPEIDITAGEESGPVSFDAVVEVRPRLQLEGYGGLRVTIPSPLVTPEELDSQVDRMRANFATLEVADRPARDGDNLTIDIHATQDGQPVAGLSTDDFVYELGSATVLPELDERLQGAVPGDDLSFDAAFGAASEGEEAPTVHLDVHVKDVKEKVLPEVTDEWAAEASEFETVAELRADIDKRLSTMKRVQSALALRNSVIEALVELVGIEPPAPLVDAEVERRVHDLAHRLDEQGATVEQYLLATGQSEEQLVAELRAAAVSAVKADLGLRAVAEAEDLDPTDEDVDEEIDRLAARYSMKPAQLRRNLERADQMPAVRSDVKKSKALEWLVEHVELVDTDGNPVDRTLLDPETFTDDDQTDPADKNDPAEQTDIEQSGSDAGAGESEEA